MTVEATFRAFIDHVNAGRWAEIAELIPGDGQVTYNKHGYPRDEFLAKLRQRIGALPEGAFEIDAVVSDEAAQVAAVRIIYRTNLPPDWEDKDWEDVVDGGIGMATRLAGIVSTADMAPRPGATAADSPSDGGRRLTGLHHLFCWIKDGRFLEIKTIGDVDGVFRDENAAAVPPDFETDATSSAPAAKRLTAAEMSATYRAYIGCINARTMDTDLARFCHPTVRHNGRDFSLAEYSGLMKDAQQAIEGLNFMIQIGRASCRERVSR